MIIVITASTAEFITNFCFSYFYPLIHFCHDHYQVSQCWKFCTVFMRNLLSFHSTTGSFPPHSCLWERNQTELGPGPLVILVARRCDLFLLQLQWKEQLLLSLSFFPAPPAPPFKMDWRDRSRISGMVYLMVYILFQCLECVERKEM